MSRLLYHFGYDIVKVDRSTYTRNYRSIHIPAIESKKIDAIFQEFSNEKAEDPIFGYKNLKSYLSEERVYFFYELMELCGELEIDMNDKSVADIGSGMGYLLRCVKNKYTPESVTGYDTFEEILPLAQKFCEDATFQSKDLFDVDTTYDIVFCTEVIEHMIHPGEALKKLYNILNSGGILIITVPDGRKDTHPAKKMRDDGTAYWGHINFWSPENWPVFLQEKLPTAREINTGYVNRSKLYGIIKN